MRSMGWLLGGFLAVLGLGVIVLVRAGIKAGPATVDAGARAGLRGPPLNRSVTRLQTSGCQCLFPSQTRSALDS